MSRLEAPHLGIAGLADAFAASGALRGACVSVDADEGTVITGEADLGDRLVALRVELGSHFPTVAPVVRLVHASRYGHLPHVNRAGIVCLARHETILVDPDRGLDALGELVDRATRILAEGFTGRNRSDVQEEWGAYWRGQPGALTVDGHVSPHGAVRSLTTQKQSKNNPAPRMVADAVTSYTGYYGTQPWCGDLRSNGLFVPLQPEVDLIPPLPGEVWQARDYRDRLLSRVSASTYGAVMRHVERHHGEEVVVFSLPRRHGGHTLFGVYFDQVRRAHPLHPDGEAGRAIPLSIRRLDPDFLRPRGGAAGGLHRARVVVIGCGSVGAYVAVELARAGVGHIELVDGDALSIENTFRHHLSRAHVTTNKAQALAADLRDRIPYVLVRPHACWLEDLGAEAIPWGEMDLVVLATGRVGSELALSRRFFEGASSPKTLIHTWTEPLGIGGHALLSLPRDRTPGCLRCLYTAPGGGLTTCRASLADPSAEADVDLSGCGSRFTPFGNLDAVRTAITAVDLAISALRAEPGPSELRSWLGDAGALRRAGIDATRWYSLGEGERASIPFAHSSCPVCRSVSR